MSEEKTTIYVDNKPTEVETQPLTVLCHNQPMRIEVPTHFEINGRNTIDLVRELRQDQWDHIRTGGVFKPLFDIVFQDAPVKLPVKVSELEEMDYAVQHVAGMVIMLFEHAVIKGEKIFLRLPETHLHPAQTRHLVDLMNQVQAIANGKPNVITNAKPKRKRKPRKKKGGQ
jgi:hypothetical protein